MVSRLANVRQIGSFPEVGMKMKPSPSQLFEASQMVSQISGNQSNKQNPTNRCANLKEHSDKIHWQKGCPLPTSTPRVYNQTPPVCFGVLGSFHHLLLAEYLVTLGFGARRIRVIFLRSASSFSWPQTAVIWAEKPLRSYNAFGWRLPGYIHGVFVYNKDAKVYIHDENIKTYIRTTNKNAYILDLYTENNMWQHIRYQQVKHGPKNRCTIAKPEVFGWTFSWRQKLHIWSPFIRLMVQKLWKNLLKLGSEYPTLCRLLYLTGG